MKKVKEEKVAHKNPKEEELKNQLAKALADYDNLRKRTDEEKKVWITFASQRILEQLLPVLDNLEKALKHTQDQGLAIAVTEFKALLKDEGLKQINPQKGDDFNHDLMEAIETIETEDKNMNNKIESVAVAGWKFEASPAGRQDGPVIRHAKVKVYKQK
ncbi:nucleotide exchange factor GrpE [Candidatus Woesebacteria bacterium]|nr:nucleotide exchange factor GrpE [Candidatus Woesebacteria bacterium]QQG47744.1 MAG: nucleotide exchange factor GrpE [Candidatus Woesebacteria bacterium]